MKKTGWLKWGAMAACFCLLVAAVTVPPNLFLGTTPVPPDNNDFPIQTDPNQSEGPEHTKGPLNPWQFNFNTVTGVMDAARRYILGYDVTEDGLEVNEAETEVVKYIFDRTQEFSVKPPEDIVQAVINECRELGKELSAEEAAGKVSLSDIMHRVEREVKEQWPEQYEAMLRKQHHNRYLAAQRESSALEPLVDRETWNSAQKRMGEKFSSSGPVIGGMGM